MNTWTEKSVVLANSTDYLDKLFDVYEISDNERREIAPALWNKITEAFNNKDSKNLVKLLLSLELFPVKDSYVAYFKRDSKSIDRNPETVERIANRIYSLGLEKLFDRCTEPKETNRQMGPLFKVWIDKNPLGVQIFHDVDSFINFNGNAVLNVSDDAMKKFASDKLGYERNKGLDFVGKFSDKYILGEAKFLTDFGGHQNAQFADAVSTIQSSFHASTLNAEVITIGILDGVLYIKGKNKLYTYLEEHPEQTILSALLLKEFLLSL